MIVIMRHGITSLFDDAPSAPVPKGGAVFRTGARASRVFFVREGRVALVRYLPPGGEIILHRAGPAEIVAEASVYADRYHCDCIALEAAQLASLPIPSFRARLAAEPELAEDWARHLSHAVQSSRFRAEIRSLRTVAERLDAWLSVHGALPERGHWQNVAQELSVSREALYRELARRKR